MKDRIVKYFAGRRLKKRLLEMKRQYEIECNDLACFRSALPRSIRKCNDGLSQQLRASIGSSQAECIRLNNKIQILESGLSKLKMNNVIITTG